MTGAGWLWIALGATLLGGLFSALFQSLGAMVRATLEDLARTRDGAVGERRIAPIVEDPVGHATAVGLPRIVCNLIVVAGLVFWSASVRGVPGGTPEWPDAIIGIAAATFFISIFGLLVPHSVAAHAAETTVYAWSPLLRVFYVAHAPLRAVARVVDEIVRRLAGKEASSDGEALQAELMSVVEEARHEGQFDLAERDMIEAVVRFKGTTVEQIMTPRTEMEALELTNNLGDVTRFIRACRHSRVPVYEGSPDHVVGIFYIKDLMRWLAGPGTQGAQKPFELRAILRPALFVPETKTVRELLNELISRKVHIAMVADEYGGTSGLVTFEDIVEEVFGEIRDEYEVEEETAPEVTLTEQRVAEIDGRAYIEDANEQIRALGVELPEGEDYDTVGGLVVTTLGRIPTAGEKVRFGHALITVLDAEPTRVARVRLEVREPEPVEPEALPAGEAEIVTPRRAGAPVAD